MRNSTIYHNIFYLNTYIIISVILRTVQSSKLQSKLFEAPMQKLFRGPSFVLSVDIEHNFIRGGLAHLFKISVPRQFYFY